MSLGPDRAAEPTAGIASMPMYDLPEVREATDEFWRAVRASLAKRGIAAPATLDRSNPIEAVWGAPTLLLSQTCGYPLVTVFRGRLRVVGIPIYDATGCEGPFNRAAIVVRAGSKAETLLDLKGARCAINDLTSNTGMNLLRAAIAPLSGGRPFFSSVEVTGSHTASLWQVGVGQADVACIDAVTLALLRRYRPTLAAQVRVLAQTDTSPSLPFVTSIRQPIYLADALRHALAEAARTPSLRGARDTLLLEDIVLGRITGYASVLGLAQDAAEKGYPVLH